DYKADGTVLTWDPQTGKNVAGGQSANMAGPAGAPGAFPGGQGGKGGGAGLFRGGPPAGGGVSQNMGCFWGGAGRGVPPLRSPAGAFYRGFGTGLGAPPLRSQAGAFFSVPAIRSQIVV